MAGAAADTVFGLGVYIAEIYRHVEKKFVVSEDEFTSCRIVVVALYIVSDST